MLTANDLGSLEKLIDHRIDEKAETTLATKSDISNLPTKDEFFEREDKLMSELKTVREEMTILSDLNRKVNDHDIRLEKVEKKLQIQTV
jgi:hypothetical protein